MKRIVRTRNARRLLAATILGAAAPAVIAAPEAAPDIETWRTVSDQGLAQMRGGLDLGVLIANFSIERLVRIDGEVVARTRLALSDSGNFSGDRPPDVALVGNLASLIQIGGHNAVVPPDRSGRPLAGQFPSQAPIAGMPAGPAFEFAAAALPDGTASSSAPGQGAAPAASGSISATSSASGEFGAGLATGVRAANGELPGQPAGASPATGSSGRSVTVSSLANTAALLTTIQNSVAAVRIETETRIDATMSSLAALRASNLAFIMQQQQSLDVMRR